MRLIPIISWALLSLVCGFSFCIFGWTAANIAAPVNDPNFPLPGILWTLCMATVSIIMLLTSIYALIEALDECLPKDDPRRLLG